MRATGMVRKVDELGRVVIPKETRQLLSINQKDSLEIFEEEKKIILKKYSPGCIFCGNIKNVTTFKEVAICEECIKELKTINK